jgi:hypothetical protein
MQEEKDSFFLPPRTQVHRTEKGKWTMLFYRICLVLLIGLAVGSAVWGIFFAK